MLHRIKFLEGYTLWTNEGRYGKVHEFYFDKNNWSIRYLVADLGSWLQNKFVLIDSAYFGIPEKALKLFAVKLTKEQIDHSPDVHILGPALRADYDLTSYFTWPNYFDYPQQVLYTSSTEQETRQKERPKNPVEDLISSKETETFRIHASDGFIGHIDDLLAEEGTWEVKELIVNTRNLFVGGKKVIVQVKDVEHVDMEERCLYVNMNMDSLKHCPEVHYSI